RCGASAERTGRGGLSGGHSERPPRIFWAKARDHAAGRSSCRGLQPTGARMIQVQAFRNAEQQGSQGGLPEEYAKDRKDEDTKPARKPLLFLAVLLGVIAYLQSFIAPKPAQAQTEQQDDEEAG